MTPAKILIVEDERVVARDIQYRLTRLGYQVAGVTCFGEEAVKLAGETSPDLVLMDIRLEGEMDGVVAAQEIRNRYLLPVVYLTAYADEDTLQRARVTEPFGYILKPFDERELHTVIEMALYKHQAERRLRESEHRYAVTLSSIGDGVIATDSNGRVTFLNPTAQKLTGWSTDEAAGRPLPEVFRIINEDTRNTVEDPVVKVLREGIVVGLANHTLLIHRDGHELPIDDCGAPIRDDRGGVTGAVLVFHDMSDRRRLEEQIRQSQKMEAVGRLAGGVAHDFNNLLTAIICFSELLLLKRPPEERARELIGEIHKAGERGARLINQLLAFSRKQVLTLTVLNLNSVIAGMQKMLATLIGEDIELQVQGDRDLGLVKADLSQIEQVIINLAVNAKDAMAGGGVLTLESANQEVDEAFAAANPDMRPGSYVRLRVSDTGRGIDPSVFPYLFEPFFTTKEIGKGTGLGLATVYGIVKQSGGHIVVSSSPGNGTTFHVYLPQLPAGATTDEAARLASAALPQGGETILLVEDDKLVRGLSRSVLADSGYTVLEAVDGADAMRVCAAFPGKIHLMVTDVVMPGMSGRELADRLVAERPGLRILYVSGYTSDKVIARGVVEGDTDLLRKPFRSVELARKVRTILDRS
jgi:PAS domain S-box-containing protein